MLLASGVFLRIVNKNRVPQKHNISVDLSLWNSTFIYSFYSPILVLVVPFFVCCNAVGWFSKLFCSVLGFWCVWNPLLRSVSRWFICSRCVVRGSCACVLVINFRFTGSSCKSMHCFKFKVVDAAFLRVMMQFKH